MNYLLDTNILLIYTQASHLSKQIETQFKLLRDNNMLFISVVTLGEIESLMLQRNYGTKKKQAFRQLLQQIRVVDINIQSLIGSYAEIDAFSQGKLQDRKGSFTARNMGKNDLWIAATSSVYNLTLITTDKDFNHLDQEYISLTYIDIEKYRS